MPQQPYVILWDLDGVLVDSARLHYLSWQFIFSQYNVAFSEDQFRETFGMNNRAIVSLMMGNEAAAKFAAAIDRDKEAWFRENISGNMFLFPGVQDWLTKFLHWNYPQAVASSGQPATIDATLDGLGIRLYFNEIVSASNLPSKPNPDVFLKAADLLHASPDHCLVIEDSIAGVQAAKNAGMKCLAVETSNPAERLRSADLIVNRLNSISEQQMLELLAR